MKASVVILCSFMVWYRQNISFNHGLFFWKGDFLLASNHYIDDENLKNYYSYELYPP